MNLQQIANFWLDRGIATIPIGYCSKRPVLAWKHYQSQLPTKHELKRWFNRKYINIAIITGHQNLVIIDFDSMAVWELWQSSSFNIDNTYRVKTSRGMHVYLYITNPPERTLKLASIDVKAAGGYCLCPPSIHPSGHAYTALNGDYIATVDNLNDVLPCMMLEQAQKPIEIPKLPQNNDHDPWHIPVQINGNSIAWIKSNVDVLSFFPGARQSSNDGRWYTVLCPFHDDSTKSGWIDTERQKYGCMACLNGSLDVIDLVCLLENINRSEAIKKLAF